jgi:hypothetical protein
MDRSRCLDGSNPIRSRTRNAGGNSMSWGPWRGWNAANACGYPSDVRQGDIVQADLAIRVSRIGSTSNPAFVPDHVFRIETAECFLLVPDCTPKTTHIVAARLRVWNGQPDIELALAAEEEELLRLLMAAVNEAEAV